MTSQPSTSGKQFPMVVKQEPVVKEEPQSDGDDEGSGLYFEVVSKVEPIWGDDEPSDSGTPANQEKPEVSSTPIVLNSRIKNGSIAPPPPPSEPFIFFYKDWNHKCDRCSLTFPSNVALLGHIGEHRAIDLRLFQCQRCQKCFGTKDALDEHGICQGRTFQCSKCWKQFENRSMFTKHSIIHRKERIVQFLDGEALDTSGIYRCKVCGASYQTLNEMRNHSHSHSHLSREEPLRCSWCGKQCIDAENLRSHEESHGLLRCDVCEKPFCSQQTLLRHKYTHEKNKYMELICPKVLRLEGLFKCLVCRKVFERYEAALFHVRSHVNALEGRYQCLVCDLKCSSGVILRQHMRIHHRPEGPLTIKLPKPRESGPKTGSVTAFCCPECGTYSKNAISLKAHIRRHKYIRMGKYVCDVCTKNCGTSNELIRHQEKVHNLVARIVQEEEKTAKEYEMEQEPLESITVEDSSEDESPPTVKKEPLEESEPEVEQQQQLQQQTSIFDSVVVKEEPELCEEKSTKFIIESCVKGEPGEGDDDGDEDEEVYYVVVVKEEDEGE